MGLVARFDFMPRVALNVFQQVPSSFMPVKALVESRSR
jgi:hypothetical protein